MGPLVSAALVSDRSAALSNAHLPRGWHRWALRQVELGRYQSRSEALAAALPIVTRYVDANGGVPDLEESKDSEPLATVECLLAERQESGVGISIAEILACDLPGHRPDYRLSPLWGGHAKGGSGRTPGGQARAELHAPPGGSSLESLKPSENPTKPQDPASEVAKDRSWALDFIARWPGNPPSHREKNKLALEYRRAKEILLRTTPDSSEIPKKQVEKHPEEHGICLECRVVFKKERSNQKFHDAVCRLLSERRQRSVKLKALRKKAARK